MWLGVFSIFFEGCVGGIHLGDWCEGLRREAGGEVHVCCNVLDSKVMIESNWEHAFCHCLVVKWSGWRVIVSSSISKE